MNLKIKNTYIRQKGGALLNTKNEKDRIVIDDIHFWSHQMEEHAEFMYLGLVEPSLKNRSMEFKKIYEDYHNRHFMSKGIEEHKLILDDSDFQKLKEDLDINEIVKINEEFKKFKEGIIDRLKKGEWLGWLWQSFIQHLLDELNYFNGKIQLKYDGDEVQFWNKMNADHVGSGGHLLDPDFKNDELIVKSFNLYHELQKMDKGEKEQLIHMSLNYAKELDVFHKKTQDAVINHKIDSVIHPLLIEHIVREGERSIYSLTKLAQMIGKN